MRLIIRKLIPFFLTLIFFFGGPHLAAAQSISAAGLIAEINALRASQGLAPYRVDSGLMATAQEHSEYQARIGQGTHTHSGGQNPAGLGLQENIANGSAQMMTSSLVVYQIWADAIHMHTMTAFTGGALGVGVAANGDTVYVTLDVRPEGAAAAAGNTGTLVGNPGNTAKVAEVTPNALAALVTNTPRPDGTIIHQVGYGESLWSIAIAYGVTINEIRALNGLAAGSTDIYAGQRLIISKGNPVTPAVESSPTAEYTAAPSATRTPRPSATPRPTRTAAQAVPSLTSPAAPTAAHTAAPGRSIAPLLTARNLLAAAVFLGAAVLLVVFFWTFKR